MAHSTVPFDCFRAAGLKPDSAQIACKPHELRLERHLGRRSLVAAVGGIVLLVASSWGPLALHQLAAQWESWHLEVAGLPIAGIALGLIAVISLLVWAGSVIFALADMADPAKRRLVPATVLISTFASLGIALYQVLR